METKSIEIKNRLLKVNVNVSENVNVNDVRVFLPSSDINVFPCSRRGQTEDFKYYDPEARLNTERTNRLHTSVNGFKDSFIVTKDFTVNGTLIFVLAGYYIEAKTFNPNNIASALGEDTTVIYAHLSLHNNVSLGVEGYFTEMLLRQSDSSKDENYLDVSYIDDTNSGDFFVGVSFTKDLVDNDDPTVYNLPLFSYADGEWELVQASLLPKIGHGETEDSINISGDFRIVHDTQETLRVTNSSSTVNVPLTINGHTNIYNNLEVHNTIKAPAIDIKVIKNTEAGTAGANPGVFIEDDLSIATKHTMAADTLNVNNINSRVKDGTITASSPVSLTKNLTVTGDTVINGAARVNNTITAEKLIITDIDEAGAEKGEIKTPQLRVDRITSDKSEITVDNKKLIVNRSLEMRAPQPTADKPNPEPAEATIEKAIIGDLTVEADSKLKNSTGKITTSNSLTVGSYVNVGSPAIPTQTIGDIVAKNSIFAENHIAAKNTIKAPAIYQTVDSIDKPVPFIDLVEQDSGHWQLRISRVNKVTKI